MEILFVIVWLALCAAVGFYAEAKGRSGVGIFFLSLVLSPLVGLVAALAMRPTPPKRRVSSTCGSPADIQEVEKAPTGTSDARDIANKAKSRQGARNDLLYNIQEVEKAPTGTSQARALRWRVFK